jgi:hypothetical protein
LLHEADFDAEFDRVDIKSGITEWGYDYVAINLTHLQYFGAELGECSLLPGPSTHIASLRFGDWLRDSLRSALSSAE